MLTAPIVGQNTPLLSQCRRGAIYQIEQPTCYLDPSHLQSSSGFPSQSYSPAPFSSWDLNTQLASTPHLEEAFSWNETLVTCQDAIAAAAASSSSSASIQSNSLAVNTLSSSLNSTNHLLDQSVIDTIDQWLLESSSSSVNNDDVEEQQGANYSSLSQIAPIVEPIPINLQSLTLFNHEEPSRAISQNLTTESSSGFKLVDGIVLRSRNGDSDEDVYYPHSHLHHNDSDNNIFSTQLFALSIPPAADFRLELGDMAARHQLEKRRFHDDLYIPIWIRGEGSNRQGWCTLCTPGSWLNLKTSQYLYHVQNTHGVIQATGRICAPPIQLRLRNDNLDSTDAFCGNCKDWIPICSARKRRTFSAWFQHARRCHSPPPPPSHHGKQHIRPVQSSTIPLHQRRAMSSSPTIRLRAAKATNNHQRMRSLQTTSSYTMHPNSQDEVNLTNAPSQKKIRTI